MHKNAIEGKKRKMRLCSLSIKKILLFFYLFFVAFMLQIKVIFFLIYLIIHKYNSRQCVFAPDVYSNFTLQSTPNL